MARSEEEPVAPGGAAELAIPEESAKRCDPGSGPDHDQRRCRVARKAECGVRLRENLHRFSDGDTIRQIGRRHSSVLSIVAVTHGGDGEVDTIGRLEGARRDRELTRKKRPEQIGDL